MCVHGSDKAIEVEMIMNVIRKSICANCFSHPVSAIRGIHCLETLHLESCLITSRGVEQLSEVLNTDRTLLELNLSNNSIRDIGARHLGNGAHMF